MSTQILMRQGTAKVWKAAGGDYAITLAGLADGAGRMGQKADLAEASGRMTPRWAVTVELNMDVAPAAGSVIEVYWAPSRDNTTFPGGATGADGPYQPGSEDAWKKQLLLIGCLVLTSSADTVVQTQVFEFWPPAQYGCPVIVNKSGQALKGNDDAHRITLVPLVDEIP
jgi:hypothetical protein